MAAARIIGRVKSPDRQAPAPDRPAPVPVRHDVIIVAAKWSPRRWLRDGEPGRGRAGAARRAWRISLRCKGAGSAIGKPTIVECDPLREQFGRVFAATIAGSGRPRVGGSPPWSTPMIGHRQKRSRVRTDIAPNRRSVRSRSNALGGRCEGAAAPRRASGSRHALRPDLPTGATVRWRRQVPCRQWSGWPFPRSRPGR